MPFKIVVWRADKLAQFGIELHHMPVGVDDSVVRHRSSRSLFRRRPESRFCFALAAQVMKMDAGFRRHDKTSLLTRDFKHIKNRRYVVLVFSVNNSSTLKFRPSMPCCPANLIKFSTSL